MAARLPPLLEPYLALPSEASLILLTNVLGASTNWLVLRYLYGALSVSLAGIDDGDAHGQTGGSSSVVLVSFLRDLSFWRDGARRLGLDLSKLAAQKRFAFVDGLSGLFLPPSAAENLAPQRDGTETVLRSPELEAVQGGILAAVKRLTDVDGGTGKVVLIIDALDLLLATAGESFGAVGLEDMLIDLREQVHTTILTLSDDSPLVFRQETPLEISHAAFLLGVAHQADLVLSLRLLDTGTATDVSGVIRIGVGDGVESEEGGLKIEGREFLYLVGGDGGVKVFERGQ